MTTAGTIPSAPTPGSAGSAGTLIGGVSFKYEHNPKDDPVIKLYQHRILTADTKHAFKMQSIRDSRKYAKQRLPNISEDTLFSSDKEESNNSANTSRSTYCPPIPIAINNKLRAELTAMPMRFEYEANNVEAVNAANAFMKVIQRTYSQTGSMARNMMGIEHLLNSGTYIAQAVAEDMKFDVFLDPHEEESVPVSAGMGVSFRVYDPQTALIDWRADPSDVMGTAEWLVVTIGKRSAEWIEDTYGIKINIEHIEENKEYSRQYDSATTSVKTILTVDGYKLELENNSGLHYNNGIMLREYYLNDGTVYHILDDWVIARKTRNSIGYKGIPFCWCPCVLDTDSPYGIPMAEQLRPSIEVVATAINCVIDNTTVKNKMPWFTPTGTIHGDIVSKMSGATPGRPDSIVPISLSPLAQAEGYFRPNSIKDLIQKPEIQEVTEGAAFMYHEGMNNIWYVTGLSPASMSGMQDKQIRIQSVAEMISSASLTNSSQLVKNLETYAFNVLTRLFQIAYFVHYDQFTEFKDPKKPVPRELVRDIKNVRIVNGSYLASDQTTRLARARIVYDMSLEHQVLDPIKVVNNLFDSMGIQPEQFLRDPMDMLNTMQLEQVIEILEQSDKDEALNFYKQQLLEKQREQNAGQPVQ